jgi:hypothetical protein
VSHVSVIINHKPQTARSSVDVQTVDAFSDEEWFVVIIVACVGRERE